MHLMQLSAHRLQLILGVACTAADSGRKFLLALLQLVKLPDASEGRNTYGQLGCRDTYAQLGCRDTCA